MTQEPKTLVVIGGGGGVHQVIQGAQPYFAACTALVAVTDTGRSTGVARTLANIPAPGDLRNIIARLSHNPDSLFARLLQHRFHSSKIPALDGMAFGNLLIAALAELTGDFAQAIAIVSDMVQTTARIIPVSTINAHLCAELEDGTIMDNELMVRGVNKPPIRRLFLTPSDAPACPSAIEAIGQADVVVIGPGSFFTSVLATLLFKGMTQALKETSATVVFICNTTTQRGQTDGFCAFDHVKRLKEVVGKGVVDIALINRSHDLDPHLVAQYAHEGVYLLKPDEDEVARIRQEGIQPLVSDYAKRTTNKRDLWNKQDTIQHDPALLGQTLWRIAIDYGRKPTGNSGSSTTNSPKN